MPATLKTTIAIAFWLFGATVAQATIITAKTNVDNGYEIFISTDDSVAGTSFGSGEYWPTTFVDSTSLTAGVTNYLHIYAYDLGGPAMVLGEFTLSDSNFEFANGTQSLLTGDAGLLVNLTGFGSGYSATTDLGVNGTSPWGTRSAVDAAAHYVWTADNENHNQAYFSAAISSVAAVPEPSIIALFGMGLVGMRFVKRRKAA